MKLLTTLNSSLYWILIAFLLTNVLLFKSSTGHYLHSDPEISDENPADVNRNDRGYNDGQTDDFEKKILKMFGMKNRPDPGRQFRVPKLMQHLYKAHMGDFYTPQDDLIKDWEVGFDLPPHHVMSRINTARSFHHIDEEEHFPGIADHHIRLRFDLSSLPNHEDVGAAELLLHREAVASHLLEEGKHLHRINVHQIIKMNSTAMPRKLGMKQSPITRLLDTRLVDARNSSWERFDVSVATSRWAQNQEEENHGLLVEVIGAKGVGRHDPGGSHIRLKRDLHPDLNDRDWLDRRPTLLTYSNDGSGTNLQRRSRRRRSNNATPNFNKSRKRELNSSRKKKRRKKKHRPCARHNLYVDFSDVGWNVWIVAPPGYHAFYCQGQCIFPLAEHLNATNHAIVQTLANSVDPLLVPRPCCVPTQLTSISMLYEDEHRMVVLKSYPNMVVDSCGCR